MEQRSILDGLSNHGNQFWGRLAGDLAAAAVSATMVAPTVAVIDRAIVEKASSNRPLLRGLRTHALSVLTRPGRFLFSRPFGIVWTLYAATFCVANGAETISREFHTATVGSIVFVSTFLVNVPLGVWKDVRFAQLYGTGSASDPALTAKTAALPSPAPLRMPNLGSSRAATATFLLRDAVTIFGSFTLAPWLSAAIPDKLVAHAHAQTIITQLSVPSLTQLVATPLHLLGLDLYNRQYKVPWSDRLARTRRYLPSATVVRCIRIIPAFGFGCLTNTELRSVFHRQFPGVWQ